MSKFKIVTFDITGTLLKLYKPVGEMYSSVGAKFGLRTDPKLLDKNFKRGWDTMNTNYPNFGLYSGMGWKEWWTKLVHLSFDGSYKGEKDRNVLIGHIADKLIDIFKTAEGWQLVDNAQPLLDYLSDKNVTIGVVSNFDVRLHEILKAVHIADYFTFVTTSYEAACLKPDPCIFRFSEKLYVTMTGKKFEREFAIHIGNSPHFDYLGAVNAGWNAVLINKDLQKVKAKYPGISQNRIFINLKELKKYLEV